MMWQDLVIVIANIVFSVSLIPQIYHGFKEKAGPIKYQTSIPTSLGLFAISYTYLSLSLLFSAVVAFITACLWFTLFIQKLIYRHPKI